MLHCGHGDLSYNRHVSYVVERQRGTAFQESNYDWRYTHMCEYCRSCCRSDLYYRQQTKIHLGAFNISGAGCFGWDHGTFSKVSKVVFGLLTRKQVVCLVVGMTIVNKRREARIQAALAAGTPLPDEPEKGDMNVYFRYTT